MNPLIIPVPAKWQSNVVGDYYSDRIRHGKNAIPQYILDVPTQDISSRKVIILPQGSETSSKIEEQRRLRRGKDRVMAFRVRQQAEAGTESGRLPRWNANSTLDRCTQCGVGHFLVLNTVESKRLAVDVEACHTLSFQVGVVNAKRIRVNCFQDIAARRQWNRPTLGQLAVACSVDAQTNVQCVRKEDAVFARVGGCSNLNEALRGVRNDDDKDLQLDIIGESKVVQGNIRLYDPDGDKMGVDPKV